MALAANATLDVFTVANYPVEARAKDAVTAKATALGDGQQAALRSLLRRLVPVTAYRQLRAIPALNASGIIDGVAVRSERNSPTQYFATLDFSFQPEAVRETLRSNQIPFVETQAPLTVIVPVTRAASQATLEADTGVWRDAWKGLDLAHTLAPLKLETLQPDVAGALPSGLTDTSRVLAAMSKAYKSDRVILAVLEPGATAKHLSVTLIGSDAVGPFRLQRRYPVNDDDKTYTAELAAIVSLGVLEGRWKATRSEVVSGGDAGSSDVVKLMVEFATLAEWNEIRSHLLDAEGAFDVSVDALAARSAQVTVHHQGGARGLAQALAGQRLTMTPTAAGPASWLVRSTF